MTVCGTAAAVDSPADGAVGQSQGDTLAGGKSGSNRSFVILPIPTSSPSLGTGAIVSAVAFYQPQGSVRPWMTGAGILWTDNGSRGGGLFQKAYLGGDLYRLTAAAGKAKLHLKFYGIGDAAASRDRSIAIEQQPTLYRVDLLRKVATGHYLGLRLQQVDMETRVPLALPPFPDLAIPQPQLNMRLIGPGLLYEFDTRDSETGPSRGYYAEAQAQWSLGSWGASRGYSKVTTDINHYRPMGKDSVLALRASVCLAGSGAPFFDLCLFGSNSDLRGYESGAYRDRTLIAAQAEYRMKLSQRWGAVVFGGVGGVADSFSDYRFDDLLPAGGVGLRFKASAAYNVNVSVDYAVGKHSDGLYFSIGEAF